MARLTMTRSSWVPGADQSNELDLSDQRTVGLYLPDAPVLAFGDTAVDLLAQSRPALRDETTGTDLVPVPVGQHDGPFVLPLSASQPRTYEVPPWFGLLGLATFCVVDSAGRPLHATRDFTLFWICEPR